VNNAGGVLCWGHNELGQLGNGTFTDSSTPVPVKGLSSGVISIAAGGHGANCALTHNGAVWCWGNGMIGQLGNNAKNNSNVPVQLLNTAGNAPLGGVVGIAGGQDHMCALTSSGAVLCWGDNTNGKLGDPQVTGAYSLTPVQVVGLTSGAASVSPGSGYTCAVTTAGGAECWGGIPGENGNSSTPMAILNTTGSAPLSGVAAIASGYNHACALTTDGTELCFGGNSAGQIGNGTEGNLFTLPIQVLNSSASAPLRGIVQITAGEQDSCALTGGGGILCWGYNPQGEVGEDTKPHYDSPVPVTNLTSGVIEIAAGYRHNCAITSTGGVMCWGFNEYGQLGDDKLTNTSVPTAVVGVGGAGVLNLN
jgi:alpha-tubulin suppressor-like RCC1 family protein